MYFVQYATREEIIQRLLKVELKFKTTHRSSPFEYLTINRKILMDTIIKKGSELYIGNSFDDYYVNEINLINVDERNFKRIIDHFFPLLMYEKIRYIN